MDKQSIIDKIKAVGLDANNALRETKALSRVLSSMNLPGAQTAGALLATVGYGKKKRSAKKRGGASKVKAAVKRVAKAQSNLNKAKANLRKVRGKQGGNIGNFVKSAFSLPLMAAGGLLGGTLGGINNF